MDKSAPIMAQRSGERSLTVPILHSHLDSGEEHVARLVDLRPFGLLRRWNDLFDESIAADFGITDGARPV